MGRALEDRLARLERMPRSGTDDPWAAARCFRQMSPVERGQVLAIWIELTRLDALGSTLTIGSSGELISPDGAILAVQGEWEGMRTLIRADQGLGGHTPA